LLSYSYPAHPDLPSVPTRRSSDLGTACLQAASHFGHGFLARITLTQHLIMRYSMLGGNRRPSTHAHGHAQIASNRLIDRALARQDRKSTRLNSSHVKSRMPSSA